MAEIQRWIGDQRFIGYQKTNGEITHEVIEGRVEMTDGRYLMAWTVARVSQLIPHIDTNGSIGFFTRHDLGTVTFQRPRIDQEPAPVPKGLKDKG